MRPPTSCRWEFPPASHWPEDDLVCIGADLAPDTLLFAYAHGLFPMFADRSHRRLGWWSPVARGIIPLEEFQASRSLQRSMRKFTTSVNLDFEGVMRACATSHRTGNWIDEEFVTAYVELHRMGHAHSVEVWDADGSLAGGLYGVRVGRLFAGESMFHRRTDASKVALAHLVTLMRLDQMTVLDIQWLTDHLESLGGVSIPRAEYLQMVSVAVGLRDVGSSDV